MSKRMILFENCGDCPNTCFAFLEKKVVCLKVFDRDGERFCPEKGTPDWCPLPAVPEYREYYHEYGQAKDFADGWNSCLDKILAEEEQ
ncbi:MAG: hypothetical protein LUD72_14065 [Bacteroidales bacterium]|nr:hypothetical protein [Bacteroidales bacterium]